MSYNYHQRTITWAMLDKQAETLGQGLPYWSIPIIGLIFQEYDKIYGTQEVDFHTISNFDFWCVDLADMLTISPQVTNTTSQQ